MRNLLERLVLGQERVPAFLDDRAIPFAINQAECDRRGLKVGRNVSGCFRSDTGSAAFTCLRGYLATVHKQGQALLAALESVFSGQLLSPVCACCDGDRAGTIGLGPVCTPAHQLVSEPANLSALAIAGLCARSLDHQDEALRHFVSGFLAVENGTRGIEAAQYFYDCLREFEPEQALDLILRVDGLFDTPEGHSILVQEMQRAIDEGLMETNRASMARAIQFIGVWMHEGRSALAQAQAAVATLRPRPSD